MSLMFRTLAPCLAILAALVLTPPAEAADGFEKTCNHYENRARFLAKTRPDAFEIVLAASCRAAIQANGDAAARVYLERLTELRRTIVAMMITENRETRALQRNNTRELPRVSSAGEYLIARELGVISAYRNWSGLPGLILAVS